MGSVISADGKNFDVTIPVLIIGAGACGCTAALAAHEQGVEVMILERDDKPRGNTSLSGGQIPAGGSKMQEAAGIKDSADILYKDILAKVSDNPVICVESHRPRGYPFVAVVDRNVHALFYNPSAVSSSTECSVVPSADAVHQQNEAHLSMFGEGRV